MLFSALPRFDRSIGTTPSKSGDLDAAHRINIDYTKAAAEMFVGKLAPQLQGGKKFRFVYLSGAGSEKNQEQKLWFAQDFRQMRVRFLIGFALYFDDMMIYSGRSRKQNHRHRPHPCIHLLLHHSQTRSHLFKKQPHPFSSPLMDEIS